MDILFCDVFRYGEHPICLRSGERHNFAAESERVQPGIGRLDISHNTRVFWFFEISFKKWTLHTLLF